MFVNSKVVRSVLATAMLATAFVSTAVASAAAAPAASPAASVFTAAAPSAAIAKAAAPAAAAIAQTRVARVQPRCTISSRPSAGWAESRCLGKTPGQKHMVVLVCKYSNGRNTYSLGPWTPGVRSSAVCPGYSTYQYAFTWLQH